MTIVQRKTLRKIESNTRYRACTFDVSDHNYRLESSHFENCSFRNQKLSLHSVQNCSFRFCNFVDVVIKNAEDLILHKCHISHMKIAPSREIEQLDFLGKCNKSF